jgi:hypothetical protein
MRQALGATEAEGPAPGAVALVEEAPGQVVDEGFLGAIARTPLDQYLIWTGSRPVTRGRSLRACALACVQEVGVPVPLRLVVQRAVRMRSDLHPDAVREAMRQHQSANDAVVLLLRKRADGAFVAVTDIRNAVDLGRRVNAGEVVVDPRGRLVAGAPPARSAG